MDDLSTVYHEQYQKDSIAEAGIAAWMAIASELHRHYEPKTALDIGSGAGPLPCALSSLGVRAYGVDGSDWAEKLGHGLVTVGDLRVERSIPTSVYAAGWPPTYDLVTCFDTAEHVPEEFADVLCDNVVEMLRPRGVLVFGPAGPRQDGYFHVNLQHPCYWIGKLKRRGLQLHPIESELLRRDIRANPAHAHCWWVSENLMVFTRTEKSLEEAR